MADVSIICHSLVFTAADVHPLKTRTRPPFSIHLWWPHTAAVWGCTTSSHAPSQSTRLQESLRRCCVSHAQSTARDRRVAARGGRDERERERASARPTWDAEERNVTCDAPGRTRTVTPAGSKTCCVKSARLVQLS